MKVDDAKSDRSKWFAGVYHGPEGYFQMEIDWLRYCFAARGLMVSEVYYHWGRLKNLPWPEQLSRFEPGNQN